MGLRYRSVLSAATVALSFALIGCDTADTLDKLTDMIPFGDNKKPLPGDRKEVFPQGVPGVPQGVPPDMVKGNQAAEPAPPSESDKLMEAVKALHPDEMSPREALEALYALKAKLPKN